MNYKLKYKSLFFWRSIEISGHTLHKELDRMDLYRPDGSVLSLAKWSKYDMKLGIDWVLSVKKKMERESGLDVKLNI